MKYWQLYLLIIIIQLLISCGGTSAQQPPFIDHIAAEDIKTPKGYTQFKTGIGYNKTFNDLPELHTAAAEMNGITPLVSRDDTLQYIETGKLIRVSQDMEVFKVDELTHSVPYLVPKASLLLADISINFRDSLISKKMPLYKPIVTSITRTDADVKRLTRRNVNASESSVHRYGTTFDISWARFEKVDPLEKRELDNGRLKLILAQVLYDLRQRDRCYIKHERKQPCFHITVQ